ncbi:acyl-CoA thioesterase domain-containing protein [Hydrogenophaga sp.]|uniref:acyl-CoA thioesterase domain-containing protein n=1 Tax=Hydrogenophaga sp. TaxID=1904254 RepID=UPI002FCC3861
MTLNVSFLKTAQVGLIQGRAHLVRRGRTVAHAGAELVQGDIAVASATAVCMFVPQAGR